MDGLGGAMRIASLYAAVGVDLSGLGSGLRDAKGQLGSFEQSLGKLGTNLMGLGTKLTAAVTLPIVGGLTAAVKQAADFEARINVLSVAARQSGTSMGQLHDAALAVGRDTQLIGIDAMEAADAMTNFYKAGLSTTDIMGDLNAYLEEGTNLQGALRAAIDLAAASNLNLAQTSDAVAIAMATFGLGAEDATRIADSFVGAADASIAEVSDLVDALSAFGPTAATFGWSLEETNTALAILSQRGIRGSEAGTALKSMMTNIMRPTDDVREALSELGVTLYNTQGEMLALPDIINQLSNALYGQVTSTQAVGGATKEQQKEMKEYESKVKSARTQLEEYQAGIRGTGQSEETRNRRMKELTDTIEFYTAKLNSMDIAQVRTISSTRTLTEEERNLYIQTLAGTYGMKAMQTLLAEGAQGWADMESAIADAATAQEVGETRTRGFTAAMEQLQGAMQTFLISVGEPFLEKYATPMAQRLTDIVNVLSELTPEQALTLTKIGLGLAAIGPALITMGSALKIVSAIGMKPILIAGGILALGAAIFSVTDKGQELIDTLWHFDELMFSLGGAEGLQTWITIRQGIAGVSESIRNLATGQTLAEALGLEEGTTIGETWLGVGEEIWRRLQEGIGAAITGDWLAEKLGVAIGETPQDTWRNIGTTVWNLIGAGMEGAATVIGDWGLTAFAQVGDRLRELLGAEQTEDVLQQWRNIGLRLGEMLFGGIADAAATITGAPLTILARWADALRVATGAEQTEDVWEQWKNVGIKIGQNLWAGLVDAVTGLPEKLTEISGGFRTWAEGRDMQETGAAIGETIGEGLGTVIGALLGIGWEIGKTIVSGVGAILLHVPTITKFVVEFAYTIGTVVGDTIAGFEAIGAAIGAGILKGLATKLLGEEIGQWLFEQLAPDAPLRKWLDAMKYGPALAIPRLIGEAMPKPEVSAEDALAAIDDVFEKLERVWPSETMRQAFITLGIMPATEEEAEEALRSLNETMERAMPGGLRIPIEPEIPTVGRIASPERTKGILGGQPALEVPVLPSIPGGEQGWSLIMPDTPLSLPTAPQIDDEALRMQLEDTAHPVRVKPYMSADDFAAFVASIESAFDTAARRQRIAQAARIAEREWEEQLLSEAHAQGMVP